MQNLFANDRLVSDEHVATLTALRINEPPLLTPLQKAAPAPLERALDSVALGNAKPFLGHAVVPVKANGNIKLPAFASRVVVLRNLHIFLGLHETDACLVGFDQRWHERVTGELCRRHLAGLDGDPTNKDGYARRIFGFCAEVWRPHEGIRLSEWARAIAGITDTALFVGTGETFEIWSPDEASRSGDRNLVALARSATKFRA